MTESHEFYAHHFETYMYDCDFEDVESPCNAVLKGTRIANVSARVIDKTTGITLGEDYFGYLAYDKADKTFGGYRYILIREAIKAARSFIRHQVQLMPKNLPHLHFTAN